MQALVVHGYYKTPGLWQDFRETNNRKKGGYLLFILINGFPSKSCRSLHTVNKADFHQSTDSTGTKIKRACKQWGCFLYMGNTVVIHVVLLWEHSTCMFISQSTLQTCFIGTCMESCSTNCSYVRDVCLEGLCRDTCRPGLCLTMIC